MFKQKFIELCNKRNESPSSVCRKVGITPATFSGYTDESVPRKATLMRIADYFGVTVDYLLGKEETKKATDNVDGTYSPTLTEADELDISKRLDAMLEDLTSQGGALMFDGEPLDDESRELLIASLENSMRMAKLIAKQKYTPKKYRKGSSDDQ